MKNVYKSKFPKAPKAVKQDNKRLAAFILLGFFIFTAIGSILGIIAFARTSKEESAFNVVSANADVVDDFVDQNSVNKTIVYEMSEFFTGYHSVNVIDLPNNKNCLLVGYRNFDLAAIGFNPLIPFNNYVVQGLSPAQYTIIGLTLSFDYDFTEDDENNIPELEVRYYGEEEEYLDSFSFDYDINPNLPNFSITYYMNYPISFTDYDRSFIEIRYPQLDDTAVLETFKIYEVQVYERSSIKDSSYTEEQLNAIYNQAIDTAYYEGLSRTDGYQDGYDDGYLSAVGMIDKLMNNLLQYSTSHLIVNRNGNRLFDVVVENDNKNYFMVSRLLSTTYAVQGYEYTLADYFYYDFVDFTIDLPLLSSYSFMVSFSSDMEIDPSQLGLRLYIGTDYDLYYATITKINDYNFRFDVDLSSAKSYEKITNINFGGTIAYVIGTDCKIENQDARYNLGYESGYWHAYDQFRNEFQQQLNQEYQDGYAVGENNGYNKGYNEGAEAANHYTFTSLIGAVVDVPIKTFTSLFNFEILGVNLANFFYALFTVCVVLAIVKLLI